MISVDHEPGNSSNIQNIVLKYQYLTKLKVALNLKEAV